MKATTYDLQFLMGARHWLRAGVAAWLFCAMVSGHAVRAAEPPGRRAAEPPLGSLIQDLTGPDARARAAARQLLPRQGVAAVADLVPLLSHGDAMVAAASFSILLEIGNEVSVPGREVDRGRMTGLLMPLVAPDRTQNERIVGLRLLERLVPAGYDLDPVAAILHEQPPLRDKARTALQRIGTPEARAALRRATKGAEPGFQCALLNALGQLQDTDSLDVIKSLTQSPDAAVRAAAIRALAWTGDPGHLKRVKEVIASASDETRFDACDALVRLLNAIETRGGNWQIGVDEYLRLLADGQGVFKDAALAGLQRIGDGTCVQPIIDAIDKTDIRTWLAGVNALRHMQGVDVTREIVRAWPGLPAETQQALLPALGERRSPLTLPMLREAAASSDPATRLAGLEALGASGLADALAPLSGAARAGSDVEKAVALQGTLAVADALRRANHKERAGNAYLTALQCARDKPAQARALEGIAACPLPAAFNPVMSTADDDELREPAIKALLGLAAAIGGSEPDKARQAFDRIRQLGPSPQQLKSLVGQMNQLGVDVDLAALLGVVNRWHVVGPFELGENNANWNNELVNEPDVDLGATYNAGDHKLAWKPVLTADVQGVVDLLQAVAPCDKSLAYARAQIQVPGQTEAVLRMGSDDGIRAWVNDRLVHDNLTNRGVTVDQDQVPVTLTAGLNTILLKVSQHGGGWAFCLRITTPDGKPLTFTQKVE